MDRSTVLAAPAPDLTGMSLEELMGIEVFSVSRREQVQFEAAAAVEVITSEDIRRSGAVRLPELLRLVSGVHAKHIDASKWAVTVRGFNNRFVNKLLVLIDGRSIYSPLFAGVFWEVQDLPLEYIDRIEVIRGPGSTMWGANAVNGVINIITKKAEETQGSFAQAGYGAEERGYATVGHGGKLGSKAFYRVYGKGFDRDAMALGDGSRHDDQWRMWRGGFRVDGAEEAATWSLSGGAYDGRMSQIMEDGMSLTPPYRRSFVFSTDMSGAYLLGRMQRSLGQGAEYRLSGYYDWSERHDEVFEGTWHIVGLDAQHRFGLGRYQSIVWGGEFRYTRDRFAERPRFSFERLQRDVQIFSGFVQDEVDLLDRRLRLTLGTKFEYNDFTGVEVLPNVRALWTDGTRHALWGAVSRAVRLPARAETEGRYLISVGLLNEEPESPLLVSRFVGNPDMKAEELLAYELGYRVRLTQQLNVDLATFYNFYDDHFSGEPRSLATDTTASPPQLINFLTAGNKISGRTLGGELNLEWKAHRRLRLRGGYAYLHIDLKTERDSQDVGTLEFVADNPENRAVLRSLLDVHERVELDAALYYTGRLPEHRDERFFSLDLRLNWRVGDGVEVGVVGQHVLGGKRLGLDPEVLDTLAAFNQRSVYGFLRWGR